MRLVHFFILFLTLSNFISWSQAVQLSIDQQAEDLLDLKLNLEKYHAGLYRYTSKDSIDLVFRQTKLELKENSIIDYYSKIRWLLSKVKCGHTRASLPNDVFNEYISNQLILPFSVKYLGDRLFIEQPLANVELNQGDEVLSINNKGITEITHEIFTHLSADGNIKTGKYRQAEVYFGIYYNLFIDQEACFEIELKSLSGKISTKTVFGKDWNFIAENRGERDNGPLLSLATYSNYAVLNIRTFDSGSINNNGQNYLNFLEESFASLKTKEIENLVIDLRRNGGGDDFYGMTLVSYLARRPFNYFERIEVTDDYDGYGNIRKSEDRNLMVSHKGLNKLRPKDDRFEGKIYILIDGNSFSTCADVATILHYNGWATFIGEESGGGYDGNTSGNSKSLTLPNSNITINIPMWKYTSANSGHDFFGRGVKPHYNIHMSVMDLISENDVVMEKALNLICEKE